MNVMPRGKETECFVFVLCRSRIVYFLSRVIRFFGPTGRGTEEHFGMTGKVDIINSTLGKALGGAAGGYTTGPKALIDLLRQRSRPYLFSNTLPPFVPVEIHSSFRDDDFYCLVPLWLLRSKPLIWLRKIPVCPLEFSTMLNTSVKKCKRSVSP